LNQAPLEQGPGRKRKPGAAATAAAGAEAKKPNVKAEAGRDAAGSQGPSGSGGDLLALSGKLRLKDIHEEVAQAAGAGGSSGGAEPRPLLVGQKHSVELMLADTVRAAIEAAGAHGSGGGRELHLRLGGGGAAGGGGCMLRFLLAARRSVQFSRAEVLALAADAGACRAWNAFVEAALAAWQGLGKEGSLGERLRLLKPLALPATGGGGGE
jgi:hypothetical protein